MTDAPRDESLAAHLASGIMLEYMRAARLLTGAILCATGAFLMGVNFLAAAVYATKITSWETSKGKMGQAYDEIGYSPSILGFVFFVAAVILIYRTEIAPVLKRLYDSFDEHTTQVMVAPDSSTKSD